MPSWEFFGLAARVRNAEASGTIYIRADGSIEPLTANMTSFDNITYSFTSNNYDSVIVERGNIIIDGAGYTLQNPGGMYYGIRVQTAYPVEPNNVTIKNLRIKGFISSAILLNYVMQCKILDNVLTENGGGIEVEQGRTGHVISGNSIINNGMGVYLSEATYSTVYDNDIIANSRYAVGIHSAFYNAFRQNNIIDNNLLGYYSGSISISGGSNNNGFYSNNIIGNVPLVYHENLDQPNAWDDGAYGNYWSDYSGQDSDKDGIGDTPHIISGSLVNVDHYPLMSQNGTVTRQFAPYSKEVIVSSNSTVQEFSFNDTLKRISFNVTGADGTTGFCKITFPNDLLWGTISLYKMMFS